MYNFFFITDNYHNFSLQQSTHSVESTISTDCSRRCQLMTGGAMLSENPGICFQDMEIQDCSHKIFIFKFFLITFIDPKLQSNQNTKN